MTAANAPKLYIGVPNTLNVNARLTSQILQWASDPAYQLWYDSPCEIHWADAARNFIVANFLRSAAEYLLFIDSDVEPHPRLLDLWKHNLPVVGGVVFAWMKGRVWPSVWERSPCAECEVVKIYRATGEIRDPLMYRRLKGSDVLTTWDPWNQRWHAVSPNPLTTGCRCNGTGLDPYIHRVHRDFYGKQPLIEVDAVGCSSMMIRRDVFAKLEEPYFQFLYKPDRTIMAGEDLVFCSKAREAGFGVWCDLEKPSHHYKTIDLLSVHKLLTDSYLKGRDDGRKESEPPLVIPASDADVLALSQKSP